jgi:membrane protease YdiL (CAAX protease family)
MEIENNTQISLPVKRNLKFNILLIVFYFILRIPIAFKININPNKSLAEAILLQLGVFIAISLLILINRKNLKDYFIDRTFLKIFFFFAIVLRIRLIASTNTLFLELSILIVMVTTLLFLVISKTQISQFPLMNIWNGLGIIGAIIINIAVSIYLRTYSNIQSINFGLLPLVFIWEMVGQFGSVIYEEPIFRGFLWGTLLLLNWKEKYIFLFQTLLFWISHLEFAFTFPFMFWVVSPIFSAFLGFLTWKSRSLIPSTFAHTLYNSLNGVAKFITS